MDRSAQGYHPQIRILRTDIYRRTLPEKRTGSLSYFSPKSITIASLRPNQIDEFYQSIFDEGMVANTVIHYHAVMRRAFQQAYKKEILSANPFDRVECCHAG